jgi:hypothetical protein
MPMKYKFNSKTKQLYQWSESDKDWQEMQAHTGWPKGIKSLEQRLTEAEGELQNFRKPTELLEVIRKNNGAADNGTGENVDESADDDGRLALMESFISMGFTEKEARIGAGLEVDELREAIVRGDSAPDFWDQVKNFK